MLPCRVGRLHRITPIIYKAGVSLTPSVVQLVLVHAQYLSTTCNNVKPLIVKQFSSACLLSQVHTFPLLDRLQWSAPKSRWSGLFTNFDIVPTHIKTIKVAHNQNLNSNPRQELCNSVLNGEKAGTLKLP